MRIAAATRERDRAGRDILLFDLRLRQDDGSERPFCEADADGHRLAFFLSGRTDATGALRESDEGAFEIVCSSGAQGKCVRFGYAPPSRSFDAYNACVRMVRADYCGDGRTFTRDGTRIYFEDVSPASPRLPRPPANFRFEAAWGSDGALCVAKPRLATETSLAQVGQRCPRLRGHLGVERCGARQAGALIVNYSE